MRLLYCGANEVSLNSEILPFLGHLSEENSFVLPSERAPLPELSIFICCLHKRMPTLYPS